jgi:hypothetical protein
MALVVMARKAYGEAVLADYPNLAPKQKQFPVPSSQLPVLGSQHQSPQVHSHHGGVIPSEAVLWA